jgi:ATP-dependent Clp protease ATP-binding subunit ClpC
MRSALLAIGPRFAAFGRSGGGEAVYARFNKESRHVLQAACDEARRWQHAYIGTEHLLLALLPPPTGFWPRLLGKLRLRSKSPCTVRGLLECVAVDPRKLRSQLEHSVHRGTYPSPEGRLPQTPAAKRVIEHAAAEAGLRNQREVQPVHLLLGILWEEHELATQVLRQFGLELTTLRRALEQSSGPSASTGRPTNQYHETNHSG